MSRLKTHIIKKYNNALTKVLEYYDLPFDYRYAQTFDGILYLDLSRFNIKGLNNSLFNSKEGLYELYEKYPLLFVFIEFQRQYVDCDINESVCVYCLIKINEVLRKIKQ